MKMKAILVASLLFAGTGYTAIAQNITTATQNKEVTATSFKTKIEQFQKEQNATSVMAHLESIKSDMRAVIAKAKAETGNVEKYTEVYNKIQTLINAGVIEKTDYLPLIQEFAKLL